MRILRALTEARAPMSAGELARRTLLQRSSVHRALKALESTGLVSRIGTGPRSQVMLSSTHPLAAAIDALFTAERRRADSVLTGLRDTVAALRPPPRAVWVEGPLVEGQDEPRDPVLVVILDDAAALETSAERLRAAVEPLERRLDVTIETRGVTTAELATLPAPQVERLRKSLLLLGAPPAAFVDRTKVNFRALRPSSHADHDLRARAIARTIADRIVHDPSLIARARESIARRLPRASPGEQKELKEWDRILRSTSPARLRHFLVDPGERATRLRQTLPFLGILSPAERKAALGAPRRESGRPAGSGGAPGRAKGR